MEMEMETLIEELGEASRALEGSDDAICASIQNFEEQIEFASCRVRFWWDQKIALVVSNHPAQWVEVGWTRIGKHWRLATRGVVAGRLEVVAAQPLVNAGREVRAEANLLLHAFTAALVDHVRGVADRVAGRNCMDCD
jgi:hypothetical protein